MNLITIKLIHPDNYPEGIDFGPNPMTVLELHRAIQGQQDNAETLDDQLDITDKNASVRYTDELIRIQEPYYLTEESFSLLKEGAIVQKGNEIWRSNVNGW